MSILTPVKDESGKVVNVKPLEIPTDTKGQPDAELSTYLPSDEDKAARAMIINHFTLGYMNMYKPRVEFNDLSVIQRDQVDQMLFNTYQPNNGEAYPGDEIESWRSRAMRPVVRNKCISVAAHATARLIFPKLFAYNESSDEQRDAAAVMSDLMEWSADKSKYHSHSLYRVITAMSSPASIGYSEYTETYRQVKRPKPEGGYDLENICDETLSGFQDVSVPVDELYIENFFEPDIQKQSWLIWRKVISYSRAHTKYASKYPKFKYVREGVQTVLNDANQAFYQVYDTNMRQYDVEEITYWNSALDLKLIMVNGVLLTDHDNPNPRNDKLYPFNKFGYEVINNRCFYYKSLAFKMMHDANIINTLYPMIIDGTYLNLMPPMIQRGMDVIGSDVIVPGAVTTLQDKDGELKALSLSNNIREGMDALFKVEESINQSSQDPLQSGQQDPGKASTAYQISRLEQNAQTVLGLFIQMISQFVRDYGKLRLGDILQYLTIADVSKITDNSELVYKTFLLPKSGTKAKTHKIVFDGGMPTEPLDAQAQLDMSYKVMDEQGGPEGQTELYKVNPELFRNLTYMITVDADVLNPRSEELERAYDLETYDKLIANPRADQEAALGLLLNSNPRTKRSPDKFIMKQQPAPMPAVPRVTPDMGASPLTKAMGSLPQGGPAAPQGLSL